MKNILYLAFASSLLASPLPVFASSFSTSVEVIKQQNQVTVQQAQPMVLPQINLENSIKNGSFLCDTSGRRAMQNNCIGNGQNAIFILSGAPNSTVSINLTPVNEHQNGLKLTLNTADFKDRRKKRTLGPDGKYTFEVVGELKLLNKAKVTNQMMVFDFDVTAVYD